MNVLIEPNFDSFRAAARSLLAREVDPSQVRFVERGASQLGLFGATPIEPTDAPLRLPRAYVELAEKVACAGEWELLYRVAYRLLHGEPDLLEIPLDHDTARIRDVAREVMHEVHHLHAFVRFRTHEGQMFAFIAPRLRVLRVALPFFVKRFGEEPFTLATPSETAEWDGRALHFGPGIPRDPAPPDHEVEDLFKDYYGAVFDPARANRRLVEQKMPARFRAGMPEVEGLETMLRSAGERVAHLVDRSIDMSLVPTSRSLPVLREAAASCRGCDICEMATQTVFGEGPADARAMLVGEQPGDREDLEGRAFVGPAGRVLDEALRAIGVDRSTLYVTNAVKHFKWEPRGKQRLHRSPKPNEIVACRPWLEAEIEAISPHTIVALGAVAARSFFGPAFRLHKARGRLFETRWCKRMLVTHHPAAILRAADRDVQRDMREELEADLALALHSSFAEDR